MSRVMQCALSLAIAATALSTRPVEAQQERAWFVRGGAATTGFGPALQSDDPLPGDPADIGPGAALRFGGGVGRRIGPVEVAIDASRGTHSLLGGGDDGNSAALKPGYALTSVVATAAYPIVRTARGARLQVFAGPSINIWSGNAVIDERTVWGGLGGLEFVVPVADWLALDLLGSVGASGNPNTGEETEELTSSYDVTTLWSRELRLTLRASF